MYLSSSFTSLWYLALLCNVVTVNAISDTCKLSEYEKDVVMKPHLNEH